MKEAVNVEEIDEELGIGRLICFPKGQRSFSKTNGKTIRQEKVKMN
jgi:hypothetical protein